MIKQIEIFRKIMQYAQGNLKWYIFLAVGLSIKSAEALISPLLISKIIDESISTKDINSIITYSVLSVVLYFVASISSVLSQGIATKIERKVTQKLRTTCVNSILGKSGFFYTNTNSSELLTLLMQDIENVSGMLSSQVISILYDIVMIMGVSVFLIYTYWKLAIIVFLTLIVLIVSQKRLNIRIERATSESRKSVVELQRPIQELVSNMLSFIMGNMGEYQKRKIQIREETFARVKVKTAVTIAEYGATISFISGVLVAIIIGLGSFQVIEGEMSIGVLLAFQIYTQRLLSPLSDLSNISADMATVKVSFERIEHLLDRENYEQKGSNYCAIGGSEIILNNVTFGYKKQEKILNGMSVHIEKGKVHAFVGESGAGKSTIVSLIFGLWICRSGEILIDGKNIQEYSLNSLRKKISIVSQTVFLLDDTILNNIILDDLSPDEKKAKEALVKAKIWDYIGELENGWHSRIGENGIRLSGGEKQRLAIARAIYKNAEIIFFDEATSMLDNETENEIIHQILSIFKEKTVIMIAHRLTTVKSADSISVLNQGTIVEEGTHDELLMKKGYYYNLYCYQK